MHAHSRTLISSLGFADPDKSNRLHDLACRYLATPKVHRRIVGLLPVREFDTSAYDSAMHPSIRFLFKGDESRPLFEVPVIKGEGQYRSVVGFVDLILDFRKVIDPKTDCGPWREERVAVVEVKITPVSVGDILRQLALYSEFSHTRPHWVVATRFPLSAGDVSMLQSKGIIHVLLGKGFDAWVAEQEAWPETSESIEL